MLIAVKPVRRFFRFNRVTGTQKTRIGAAVWVPGVDRVTPSSPWRGSLSGRIPSSTMLLSFGLLVTLFSRVS
jgi:hypothetical protein